MALSIEMKRRLQMDILGRLGMGRGEGYPVQAEAKTLDARWRPQTLTEILDEQIKFHEAKIADLKAAKEAISPEVERALNAIAKL